MEFPSRFSELDKIDYLQRKIIISSILYYELNQSPISDKEFDELCRQLVELQSESKEIEKSQYYYVMKDFDGSTGFDLVHNLNEKDKTYLTHLAYLFGNVSVTKEKKIEKKSKKVGKFF